MVFYRHIAKVKAGEIVLVPLSGVQVHHTQSISNDPLNDSPLCGEIKWFAITDEADEVTCADCKLTLDRIKVSVI